MKQISIVLIAIIAFTCCTASCKKSDMPEPTQNNRNNNDTIQSTNTMIITVGTKIFSATLNDNATVKTFKAMMPMTINMSELNGNEKFYYFSSALPTSAIVGGSIMVGDIMLYGNNCLVLFYENLSTSYSYTRLGKVDNAEGLKAALGTGNVVVKFELQ